MNTKLTFKIGLLALCLSLLGGCGTVNSVMNLIGFKGTRLAWKEVLIDASEGANQNSPVAIDIVFALDEASIDRLTALTASKWFSTRADLLRTFPGTVSYKSWELTPGQTLRLPGSTFGSPNVVAVFVFADYLAPGEHRVRVEQLQNGIIVQLGAKGFSVGAHKAE